MKQLQAKRFKFIDESGINLAMTRSHARAAKGVRAIGSVPKNYGSNVTIIGALSINGLDAVMSIEGATDGEVFSAYLEKVFCPTLRKGDIVIMDNLSVHKADHVRQAIEACGAQLIYLPRYSPDFNPIEQCWSKIKAALRAIGARTTSELDRALTSVIDLISKADARAWFAHCDYPVN